MAENFYNDLVTHESWRRALVTQRDAAPDPEAAAYWDHEIVALDRLVAFHQAIMALPAYAGDPVEAIAQAMTLEKLTDAAARALVPQLAQIAKDLHSTLLDAKEDLREENRRHQKAAIDRDEARSLLAALTTLPGPGRASILAAQLGPEFSEVAAILNRVETTRFEYELGRKVCAEQQRQLEHEQWRREKAETKLAESDGKLNRERLINGELRARIDQLEDK